GPLKGDVRHKPHLLFPVLADLVRHPRILDAIEDGLGPDILCWSSNFFIKEATDPAFVSWHQDSTYWGLSSPDVATAWVPLNLRPGEMSLHHVRLVHGSAPNPSFDRRIGFAIRYIPTSIQQVEGEDSATLVRGEDRFHHFEHEPSPRIDMDPALLELH